MTESAPDPGTPLHRGPGSAEESDPRVFASSRLRALAVALLATLALFATFGLRSLEERDSLRFPEVAREILETGEWSVMHLHGEPYRLKPPLQFWLVAAVGRVAGEIRPWVARLPSVLGAWGMVMLTWWMGTFLAGPRAAAIAAAALGSGTLFFMLSQMSRLDPLFACFGTLAMALYLRRREDPGGFDGARGMARVAGIFAALGAATLVKGPQVLLFFLPVVAADCAWERRWSFFRPRNLAVGAGVYLALLLVWILPIAGRIGWAELQNLAGEEIGERVVGGSNYASPWYHYFLGLPVDLLPWTFWWPAALWIGFRPGGPRPAIPRVLALWAALPLVLFSFAVSKNTRYLLPAFPAYALLLGIVLAGAWEGEAAPLRLDGVLTGWTRLMPVLAIGIGIGLPIYFRDAGMLAATVAGGAALIAGSVWVLAGDRRRLFVGALTWTAMLAICLYHGRSIFYGMRQPERGTYAFAARRIRESAGDRPLVTWRFGEEAIEFYSGRIFRQIGTADELAACLCANPETWVIAQPPKDAEIRRIPGFRLEEQLRVEERSKDHFILLRPTPGGD